MIGLKPIIPPKLNAKAMIETLRQGFLKVTYGVDVDLAATTKDWSNKPEHTTEKKLKGPIWKSEWFVSTEIWNFLDKGTEPHLIYAGIFTGKSTKRALAFPGRFVPKTKPNTLFTRPGFKGKRDVVRPFVKHPGNKPRNWTPIIAKRWRRKGADVMRKTMKEVAIVSGHKI